MTRTTMTRALASVVLTALVLAGCASGSGAFDAYQEFARALAEEDFEKALEMTAKTSPAKAQVLLEKARKGLLSDGTTVTGTSYALDSEAVKRTVTLTVTEKVEVEDSGPGVRTVSYVHEVVLQETDDGWRVISFERNLQE